MRSFKQHLEACWSDYKQVGMKKKGDKMVPNCVPKNESIPPEVVGAAIAAPMVAQGIKHTAKGVAKAIKGAIKARRAIKNTGQRIADKVVK
jgi:hypothetical protein